MMMTDRIRKLFDQYRSGSLTREEWDEMLNYFQEYGVPDELDASILSELKKESRLMKGNSGLDQSIARHVERRLRAELAKSPKRKSFKKWWAISAASVAAAVLIMAGWLSIHTWRESDGSAAGDETWTLTPAEILPGGNRASLTLSDGRVIDLDESQQGIIVDGQEVRYQDGSTSLLAIDHEAPVETITLSTPRGGTYSITLPDGTRVWLNAASTLIYPVRFATHERVVYLEGEAYFDVQALEGTEGMRPFRVESASQQIEVLGTEFNVSAYPDESIAQTTLIEGSVRVFPATSSDARGEQTVELRASSGEGLLLKPGEQSRLDGGNISKRTVNVQDYTDWKKGEFVFRNETTRQVLLRLGRWYDVELGELSPETLDERFSGTISRYGDLQTVLDIMSEAADLQFRMDGRTIHVTK